VPGNYGVAVKEVWRNDVMAKKYKEPTLAAITYEYLGLYQQRARQSDYQRLMDLYTKALQRAQTSDEIRAALALDTHQHLPVQMKSPAYERLLALEGRSIRLLREYAQIMYEYGPEFSAYADTLWAEAKRLEDGDDGR
jgi:hypothetical protein